MYDLLIIGAGPAGVSASLYAKRSNLDVLILYHGISNVENASQIDNYYGFKNGISGKELYDNGIAQAQNLGVEIRKEETLNIQMIEDNNFKVTTTEGEYLSKAIIISTGNKKIKPNILGINELEGRGISYCAICDGFFYKDKNVCVIGNGSFAGSEAEELSNIASKVTILTDGHDGSDLEDKFDVITKKITKVLGDTKVEGIEFEDKEVLSIDGVFIALGEAGGLDFAKRLGIISLGDNIKVNDKMETNIPGVYACGNITGGLLQVSKAVYEGAIAGINAAQYVRGKTNER